MGAVEAAAGCSAGLSPQENRNVAPMANSEIFSCRKSFKVLKWKPVSEDFSRTKWVRIKLYKSNYLI